MNRYLVCLLLVTNISSLYAAQPDNAYKTTKRERNRLSAARYRARQKSEQAQLAQEHRRLKEENEQLTQELQIEQSNSLIYLKKIVELRQEEVLLKQYVVLAKQASTNNDINTNLQASEPIDQSTAEVDQYLQ